MLLGRSTDTSSCTPRIRAGVPELPVTIKPLVSFRFLATAHRKRFISRTTLGLQKHITEGLELNKELLLLMYRKMFEVRRFEEKVAELYSLGLIQGLAHSYIGQEAVGVGVCTALHKEDYILSVHRGHGHSIAKDVPPRYLMAELLGKETGVCKGIGGSMHATYLENGVLFSTAIVGGNIPIATGVGLAIKLGREHRVVACFFGDGATNTGAFHEGINLASIWKLPVIFVCENNIYAVSTHLAKSVAAREIVDRGVAYNIPSEIVDGMDVQAVYESSAKAIDKARKGEGPTLLECRTYRFKGHGMYDAGTLYRKKEEVEKWLKRCPVCGLRQKLANEGTANESELKGIEKDVEAMIDDAVKFAKESEYPSWELMEKMLYVQRD